jgi:dihydroxyacetone kinase-like protein
MLDAACPGEVFTSPSPDQIAHAASLVDRGLGVLFIVKNYAGDVMNFELARRQAEAIGIQVESVLIDDDVALPRGEVGGGRRGTTLTLVAEKVAGALAEAGAELDDVAAVAREANARGRTFSVALSSCVTPALGSPTFDLGPSEMEFGVGIHGEAGRYRGPTTCAAAIVSSLL